MDRTNTLTADDLIEAANAAFADGDVAGAGRRLEAALAVDPRHAELAVTVGHFKLNTGNIAGALTHYTVAAQLKPLLASAHSSRALALALLGRPDDAEAAAVEALSLKPHDSVALKVLTRLLLDRNRVEEAERIARLILQLVPEDSDAQQFLQQAEQRRDLLRSGALRATAGLGGLFHGDASTTRTADHPPPTTAAI